MSSNTKYNYHFNLKLILSLILLVYGANANAAAVYQTSLNATLSVMDGSNGNLQIFSIIDDYGTDPNTTYAVVDPFGSAGSTASSTAEILFSGADPINFSSGTTGLAVGTDPFASASAFSTAAAKGGLFLLNSSGQAIDAVFTVAWNWSISLAADNSALDAAVALSNLTYYLDDSLSGVILSEFFQTPSSNGASNSGQFEDTFTIAPFGTLWFSVGLDTTGFAQSTLAVSAIPEPETLALTLLGLLVMLIHFKGKTRGINDSISFR